MKGKAEVLEPLEQGNKGSPLTLGERRMQPNLLRCKVKVAAGGRCLLPNVG